MEQHGRIVTTYDPEFPVRLRTAAKVPDRLYVRSHQQVPDGDRVVAIVGSRAASGHAMASARSLAAELGSAGTIIVSGGAIGIDTAAHRGALDANAETAVVLACGLEAPYPARNRPLFDEIVAAGGALLSAYPQGTPPRRFHFVERNRIIAAMADAVVVACAQLGSGALHTAAFAAEYGKVVGALPGTAGCEQLIARGAAVVESADDLLAALAGSPRRPPVSLPTAGTDAETVLSYLQQDLPRVEDDIVRATGLSSRTVKRALAGLELEGLVLPLRDGAFTRSVLATELSTH
ncbi:MAG: DNA-processing protein DprA [Deltaproteobacteria bacterium]|nr:DNA-processing protein DprA [Deltaproteobacteria bacterium]